ncbi:MAG: hypothetical protein JSS91_00905 [Bacteroidetes bacterium]|nr:hypothetical protein [Bacteroidota bacterium]
MKLKIPRDKVLTIRLPEYLYRIIRMKSAKTYKSMNLLVIEALKTEYQNGGDNK